MGPNKNIYPTWKDILSVLGVFFLCGVLSGLIINLFGAENSGFNMFLGYTLQFAAVIAYALALKKWKTGTYKGVMGFSFKGANPRIILWGVILIMATSIVIEPLTNLFPSKYLELLSKAIGSGGWAMVTSILAAPILEEILFRGIIQEGLTRKYGPARGIIIAALIFGVIHIIPQQVVMASVVGLILGYIYYKTHSLLSVILIHGINNAFALFSMIITGDITMTTRELISNDKIYLIVYGVCLAILVLSMIKIIIVLKKEKITTT